MSPKPTRSTSTDEAERTLEPVAASPRELSGERICRASRPDDSIAWRVYESGDALADEGVHADPDIYNPDTPIKSELYLPLGRHGILLAGSGTNAAFDQRDVLLGGSARTRYTRCTRTYGPRRDREREMEAQNRRLDEFTSVVSHDLRNPLSVATGHSPRPRTVESEHLAAVEQAHERMDTLITDLLTLAQDGETVTDRESVALASLAENCWTTVETADATLVTDIDRTVLANESRLKQLFENLVRNAVEHAGGRRDRNGRRVRRRVLRRGRRPRHPRPRARDVIEAGTQRDGRGPGSGSAIARKVAAAHDWEISVREPDPGTRFEMTGVSFCHP